MLLATAVLEGTQALQAQANTTLVAAVVRVGHPMDQVVLAAVVRVLITQAMVQQTQVVLAVQTLLAQA